MVLVEVAERSTPLAAGKDFNWLARQFFVWIILLIFQYLC